MKISRYNRLALERQLSELDAELEQLPHLHLSPNGGKERVQQLRKEAAAILATLETAGEE